MRARGQNDVADRYQAVVDAGLTTKWSNDPAKMREQIHERQAKIKEIMGGQNVLIGGNVVAGAAGGPATAGAASGVATADALTKLAALRDRGLLTDEEFEAQKKKLLGE